MAKPKFFNSDVIFKNVVNVEGFLETLINKTLDIKVKSIDIVKTDNEEEVESIYERRMHLDLIVYTDNEILNIEINNNSQTESFIRNLFYFCKLISSSNRISNDYLDVKKHIQLNLTWGLKRYLSYNIEDKKIIKMHISDDDTNEKIYKDYFEIVYVNMDFYEKLWYIGDEKKEDPFMMMLASNSYDEMEKVCKGDEIMEKVTKKVKYLNVDPEVAKELKIENENEKIFKYNFSKGRKEGYEFGKSDGIKLGKSTALKETAKKMLKKNLDIDIIKECTNLSKKEILNIKSNM